MKVFSIKYFDFSILDIFFVHFQNPEKLSQHFFDFFLTFQKKEYIFYRKRRKRRSKRVWQWKRSYTRWSQKHSWQIHFLVKTVSTLSNAPSVHPWYLLTASPTTSIPFSGCCTIFKKSFLFWKGFFNGS